MQLTTTGKKSPGCLMVARVSFFRMVLTGGADPLVRRRPPGRPSGTRPSILPGLSHNSCPHWILFNVVPEPVEFPLVPHHMVIALFLPKRASSQSQNRVGPSGRNAFQGFHHFGQRYSGSSQQVNMIWHDHKGV